MLYLPATAARGSTSRSIWVRDRRDRAGRRLVPRPVCPPLALDLGPADLAYALRATALARTRVAQRALEEALGPMISCLSVRSGFDLWLRVMNFPAGAEVVMSAVTLPDMARIVRYHELVPVPVDLLTNTMAPTAEAVAAALTPRSCAIVIAHLFGGRVAVDGIASVAAQAGLPLVEDCAQAFVGQGLPAHPGAAVSMYSFGPIKTATALGGAVVRVAAPELRQRMAAVAAGDPVQSRAAYALRAVKYAGLLAASQPRLYGTAVAAAGALGGDSAALAKRLARGFSGAQFINAIRRRPSPGLLAMLHRRITQADPAGIARRAGLGSWLLRQLPAAVDVPGRDADQPSWWLFPLSVGQPERLVAALRAHGFDAARGNTSLAALEAPPGRPRPVRAAAAMGSVVYLSISALSSPQHLRTVCEVITEHCDQLGSDRGEDAHRDQLAGWETPCAG
jgi:perosamine synthetase